MLARDSGLIGGGFAICRTLLVQKNVLEGMGRLCLNFVFEIECFAHFFFFVNFVP